jgi:hypothetical protein
LLITRLLTLLPFHRSTLPQSNMINGASPSKRVKDEDEDVFHDGHKEGEDPFATPKRARARGSSTTQDPHSSPSSSKKKVVPESSNSTPTRIGSSKWTEWEDMVVMKSIVAFGEKGSDWNGVLKEINARRSTEDPRTKDALRSRWAKILKPKLVYDV